MCFKTVFLMIHARWQSCWLRVCVNKFHLSIVDEPLLLLMPLLGLLHPLRGFTFQEANLFALCFSNIPCGMCVNNSRN